MYSFLVLYLTKEPIEEEPDLNNKPENVILAEDVVDDSSPPKFEDIPFLPPRMYPYRKKHISSVISQPNSVGKCTPPKLTGQGFDPPFLYPEFIAKNEGSRVNCESSINNAGGISYHMIVFLFVTFFQIFVKNTSFPCGLLVSSFCIFYKGVDQLFLRLRFWSKIHIF